MTLAGVRERPSPNHDTRGGRARIDMLVLHYTGMRTAGEAIGRLCDPAARVSAHYVIEEDGTIWRLVPETRLAFHAGRSCWAGRSDLNHVSIGIEIANPGHDAGAPAYPERQIAATIGLAHDIVERWRIAPERVLAHSDVAPTRKRDPGESFPWRMLHKRHVGHWVDPAPIAGGPLFRPGEEGPPVRALQAMLALYGYGLEITGVYDHPTRAVVTAFQRHFRPERVDGEADASTIATLKALIDALPRR
jgi:N-acetylmuramoyl-L-alanine amidase